MNRNWLLILLFFLGGSGFAIAQVNDKQQKVDAPSGKDTLSKMLQEVRVENNDQRRARSTFAGRDVLNAKEIQSLPAFLGESDVLRSLRLMPGVQSVSEGNSGVYVRGGSAGHNLFLMDDMEILNPSHLMGLFSVFNPTTVGRLEVYKGNAPVYLQGRLASTILVSSVDPDGSTNGFEANIGTISSSMSLIQSSKDGRFSLVVGYRRSYLEALGWVASAFIPEGENYFKNNGYFFQDFNGKIRYQLNSKTKLTLAWYTGIDQFHFRDDEMGYNALTDWGNQSILFSLDRVLDANRSFHSSLGYTSTYSGLNGTMLENSLSFLSDFEQYQWKNRWEHRFKNHLIQAGAEVMVQNTLPLKMALSYKSDTIYQHHRFTNAALVVHIGDHYRSPSGKTIWYAGLRATANACVGSYNYGDNPVGRWEIAKVWWNLSPVLSVSHFPKSGQSLKASFSANEQNVHLSSISSIPLPFDLWASSSPRLQPETSNQLTIGYYRTDTWLDFSVEAYFKLMSHQLIFNVITDDSFDQEFEDRFFIGKGFAYGIDLTAEKGWSIYSAKMRYSYARSFRSFPEIMNGEWFKDKYDRPHDFNIQLTGTPNDTWDFSVLWTYASGCNLTLPTGRWWMSGMIMNDYESFNAFRLPAYHRLDVSANWHLKSTFFKESVLNFSIVNLYNRANPYYASFKVFMGESQYDLSVKSYQISLFPIMPSVSWRFKL
jgi:outer membrane cobalamin receptor